MVFIAFFFTKLFENDFGVIRLKLCRVRSIASKRGFIGCYIPRAATNSKPEDEPDYFLKPLTSTSNPCISVETFRLLSIKDLICGPVI